MVVALERARRGIEDPEHRPLGVLAVVNGGSAHGSDSTGVARIDQKMFTGSNRSTIPNFFSRVSQIRSMISSRPIPARGSMWPPGFALMEDLYV